jgi:hypothetical protein
MYLLFIYLFYHLFIYFLFNLLACIYRSHCVVVGAGQRRVDHFPRDEGHRHGEEGMAPLVRKTGFLSHLYIKTII